ncbi:MAG: DUF2267 domain-containing protein [Bacteroidota bacterium]
MALNFLKFAEEGQHFVNELAVELGHPEETGRTGILLRAVLHVLRERLTIAESFNLISQLPMALKGIYADNWIFHEKPHKMKTKEEFAEEVEKYQAQYGEQAFNWNKSTEEIILIVLRALNKYISRGEMEDIIAQMPQDLKAFFRESMNQ